MEDHTHKTVFFLWPRCSMLNICCSRHWMNFIYHAHSVCSFSCEYVFYTLVMCKTISLKHNANVCNFSWHTHPCVTSSVAQFVPWLSAHTQSNPFFCHEICHLNLLLLSLFLSHSLTHKQAHTLKGTNTELALSYVRQVWIITQSITYMKRQRCACVCVCTSCINQAFLGTLISISNHSLERCLKEGSLSTSWENPSPDFWWI